jgi:hypothetical protein
VEFLNDEEGTAASLAQNDYKNALLSKFSLSKLSPEDAAALSLVTQ